jgi:hypothetical protein
MEAEAKVVLRVSVVLKALVVAGFWALPEQCLMAVTDKVAAALQPLAGAEVVVVMLMVAVAVAALPEQLVAAVMIKVPVVVVPVGQTI